MRAIMDKSSRDITPPPPAQQSIPTPPVKLFKENAHVEERRKLGWCILVDRIFLWRFQVGFLLNPSESYNLSQIRKG